MFFSAPQARKISKTGRLEVFSLQKSRFRIKNVRLRRPIWFPVSQDLLRINNYYDSVSFTSWTQLATQISNRDPRQSCFCDPPPRPFCSSDQKYFKTKWLEISSQIFRKPRPPQVRRQISSRSPASPHPSILMTQQQCFQVYPEIIL